MTAIAIDWGIVLEDWCESKFYDPDLTAMVFADRVKRNYATIRSRCTTKLAKLWAQQKIKVDSGAIKPEHALTAYEIHREIKGDKKVIPAATNERGHQKSRKSGLWSDFIHTDDLKLAMESMGGDVSFQDEVLVRAKLSGVLRAGKSIDDFEKKVEQRIEDNDGMLTELDVDDMASIRKNRSNNLRDFDMVMGRLDQVRTSRRREDLIDAEIRVKRLTGDKIDAESGGSDDLDIDALLERAKKKHGL